MKFNLLLLTFSLWVIVTTRLTSQQITIDLLPGSCTKQSSFADSTLYNSCANGENLNSTNQTITQNILTKSENYPWWGTDLGDVAILDTLHISGLLGGASTTHIFYSMFPLYSRILSELMTSPVVNHIYLEETPNGAFSIPLNNAKARYLIIIADGNNFLAISNIQIIGRFSTGEIAGNNIDDDMDGNIDCDDPLLIPYIREIMIAEPTTPEAHDGQIHVLTTTQNIEYSFNGGLSFSSGTYFNNILSIYSEAGEYNLLLSNDFGCTDAWIGNPLVLPERAGPPPELDHCGNGDFHLESFSGWTGGTKGVPLGNFNAAFAVNDIGVGNNSHAIIAEDPLGFDPIVGINIPFTPPGDGFFAKLGSASFGGGMAARLTHRLNVTPENTNIDFAIAGVIDFATVDHTDGQQPFLQVRVFAPGMIGGQPDIFLRTFTAGPNGDMTFFGNSTFDPEFGEFWFLPWTCLNVDLADFVGMQVFFEFIASGCFYMEGAHQGYMYLNGICKDNAPPLSADFNVPETICTTNTAIQLIPTNISGEIINHTWRIEQISPPSTEVFISPTIPGPPTSYSDILARLDAVFIRPIPCDAELRITLSMNGICDEPFTVSKLVRVVCPTIEVDYCDLALCTDFQTTQMQGTNTCTDCTIQWNGGGYLNDHSLAFPTVLTNINGWSDYVYSVQVIEPNGCIHNDEVNIALTSLSNGVLSLNEVCIDNCFYELQVEYESDYIIKLSDFTVQIFDHTNTLFFEPDEMTVDVLPNGRFRHRFETPGPLMATLDESKFTVRISPAVPSGFCELGDCDLFLETETIIYKNRFFKVPNCYIPTVFSPAIPGENLFNPFFSDEAPYGAVYWAQIQIWAEGGALIYENELPELEGCTNIYGYNGEEPGFPWNGYVDNNMENVCGPFNNSSCQCPPGVYTYVIRYKNCLQEWEKTGTVTIVY